MCDFRPLRLIAGILRYSVQKRYTGHAILSAAYAVD